MAILRLFSVPSIAIFAVPSIALLSPTSKLLILSTRLTKISDDKNPLSAVEQSFTKPPQRPNKVIANASSEFCTQNHSQGKCSPFSRQGSATRTRLISFGKHSKNFPFINWLTLRPTSRLERENHFFLWLRLGPKTRWSENIFASIRIRAMALARDERKWISLSRKIHLVSKYGHSVIN